MSKPAHALPRILVLGAGLGGTIAAYELRDATKGRAEVTVVSDSDDYWFVPSNPWVAVRWREPDAIRVPLGVPKTGFMIESMVTAVAHNIAAEIDGRAPNEVPSWNAVCLADFGDGGVAFVAQPQIPPRNVNWSSHGKWVHLAKVGFEKYFIRKVRSGTSEPLYEKLALQMLGISKLKDTVKEDM